MQNRRSILKLGLVSVLGCNLTQELMAESVKSEKSLIFIYLPGGVTHIETFSPLPQAPIEFRSITGEVKTNTGEYIGGTFTNLAKIADKYNIVRNFSHRDANHNSAQHQLLTSHPSFNVLDGAPQKEPSYGSIVSVLGGANNPINGMPSYVKLSDIRYDKAAWLGATHLGCSSNSEFSLKTSEDRFKQRLDIVNQFEQANKVTGQHLSSEWSKLRNQAGQIILGDVADSFNYTKEKDNVLNIYKTKTEFGKNLLIARRLIERGCKFVSVAYGGWDHHTGLQNAFTNQSIELDYLLHTLINDIYDRGLNKNCMIVLTSEFGRTSKINKDAGRDHQPGITSLLISGGDYQQGRIIGKHDDRAFRPADNGTTPFDLLATIFDHFQFEPKKQLTDNSGRPRYLLEQGKCLLS